MRAQKYNPFTSNYCSGEFRSPMRFAGRSAGKGSEFYLHGIPRTHARAGGVMKAAAPKPQKKSAPHAVKKAGMKKKTPKPAAREVVQPAISEAEKRGIEEQNIIAAMDSAPASLGEPALERMILREGDAVPVGYGLWDTIKGKFGRNKPDERARVPGRSIAVDYGLWDKMKTRLGQKVSVWDAIPVSVAGLFLLGTAKETIWYVTHDSGLKTFSSFQWYMLREGARDALWNVQDLGGALFKFFSSQVSLMPVAPALAVAASFIYIASRFLKPQEEKP